MAEQQPVSGLLNIDKPKGITSHDVITRVRKLSNQRKVGHTGTLDPMATGVLLVCLGQATRLIEYLVPTRKRYRAVVQFGIATDTLDADGKIVAQHDISSLSKVGLQKALSEFRGEIEQVPPIYSALKRGGQPLYKRARAGEAVDLDPRSVTIYELEWISWHPPELTLDIECSPGTYIRALARDLGQSAGTGAHLTALIRTANGPWSLDQSVSLDILERDSQNDKSGWQHYLHALDQAITHLPSVVLDEKAEIDVKHGRQVQLTALDPELSVNSAPVTENLVRAYSSTGDLLAILALAEAGQDLWQPKKVFQT